MSWRFSGTEAHTLVKRWLLQRATETFKTCQTFSFGNWCATIFNSSLSYHLINHMQQSGQKCCWWMGVWNFKSHCGKAEILIFNPTFFFLLWLFLCSFVIIYLYNCLYKACICVWLPLSLLSLQSAIPCSTFRGLPFVSGPQWPNLLLWLKSSSISHAI